MTVNKEVSLGVLTQYSPEGNNMTVYGKTSSTTKRQEHLMLINLADKLAYGTHVQ